MANVRARMISWTISRDARIARLSCAYAKLLYTWMIPQCDNMGRMVGEPHEVRAAVFPRESSIADEDVGKWLSEMAELGLICWYQNEGMRYVSMTGWENHQRLSGNMSKVSMLPAPSLSDIESCMKCTDAVHTPY